MYVLTQANFSPTINDSVLRDADIVSLVYKLEDTTNVDVSATNSSLDNIIKQSVEKLSVELILQRQGSRFDSILPQLPFA